MKGLMIISTLIACALARPDIGLNIRNGYQYQTPTGSYLPGAGNHGSASNQFPTGVNFNHGNTNNQGGLFFNEHQQSGGHQPGNGNGYYNQGGSNANFHNTGFDNNGGYQQHQSQVSKQVYFFDSPEDLPAPTIRISGGGSVTQKNHKIIFIKAPAYQAPQVPQIPIQQQNEEKTRVYVLVKKPDDAQDIVVPTLGPSRASKPEVYFIKYKTQKEAEAHVQNIQNGAQGGNAANSVDSSATFVSTITDTKTNGGGSHIGGTGDFDQHIFAGDNGSHGTFVSESKNTITTTGGSGPNYGPALPNGSGPY